MLRSLLLSSLLAFCLCVDFGFPEIGSNHSESQNSGTEAENTHRQHSVHEPGVFVLESDSDVDKLLELHGTSDREIMFTTYSLRHSGHPAGLAPLKHLWQNIAQIGRLSTAVIISHDSNTCLMLLSFDIPCFLDAHLMHSGLPEHYAGHTEHGQPSYYQKFAWARKFMQKGFTALFIEADQFFFQDPLLHYDPSYDFQALSDWQRPHVPTSGKERFFNPAKLYDKPVPATSTGFWFARPTLPTINLFSEVIDTMLHERVDQWEQQLWNEFVGSFLYGVGKHQPVRYKILDHAQYSNFDVYKWRGNDGLPQASVMIHAGFVPGYSKEAEMKNMGIWLADEWNGTLAYNHMKRILEVFKGVKLERCSDMSNAPSYC